MKKWIVFLGLFFSLAVNAEFSRIWYLVSVKAEQTGDLTALVGVGLDAKGKIQGIVFRDQWGHSRTYTLDELRTPQNIVSYMKQDIVNFYVESVSQGKIELTFNYLHNLYNPIPRYRRQSHTFIIQPNPARKSGFEVIDDETHQSITRIYATTNRVAGKVPCGVDEIQAD